MALLLNDHLMSAPTELRVQPTTKRARGLAGDRTETPR